MNRVNTILAKLLVASSMFFLLAIQSGCGSDCRRTIIHCVPNPQGGMDCDIFTFPSPCPEGLSQAGLTDSFVGALVVNNTDLVTNLQASIGGIPVSLNLSPGLDDVFQTPTIRNLLIAQGILNPQTQRLIFFVTNNPVSVSFQSEILTSFHFSRLDGSTVPNERIGIGVTTLSLLKPGITAAQFFADSFVLNAQDAAGAPTLSAWGLIMMSLLLVTVGTMFIAGRELIADAAIANGTIQLSAGELPVLLAPRVFGKVLGGMLTLLLAGVVAATWLIGQIQAIDLVGSILSTLILAYLAHLFILIAKRSRRTHTESND